MARLSVKILVTIGENMLPKMITTKPRPWVIHMQTHKTIILVVLKVKSEKMHSYTKAFLFMKID